MSVAIISSAWNLFNRIQKQNFTAVLIQAIAMSKITQDFDEKDSKKLLWLRNNTHKDIAQSMYLLDRYVDVTKGNISNKSIQFSNGTFTQDKIQHYLCIAVEEIYEIIYRNYKDYKIEEKMYLDSEQGITEDWGGL